MSPWRRRRAPRAALDAAALVEVRAALTAGAAPADALAGGVADAVPELARALRLGTPLTDLAGQAATGDRRADLLVRALAVTERAGAGAVDAVDQAARSARADRETRRLLAARTAQSRATAVLLTALPAALAVVLTVVGADPLSYYATRLGWVTAALAVSLAAAGLWCAHRIVARAGSAADRVDPLTPPPAPREPWRLALALPPAVIAGGGVAGMGGAALAGGAAAAWALRRPRRRGGAGAAPPDGGHGASGDAGGAAEAVDLVAVALRAGMPVMAALETAAAFAPRDARAPLDAAARRVRAGRGADAALAGTGLAELGRVLGATERWGAPADDALAELADELRAERRAATEVAAERVQLALIFPTTLLTLPAFVLAVVPPLVASAFADGILAPR